MEQEKDLSRILKRVQQFINVAEGSNNNPEGSPEWVALDTEQKAARAMADALMLEYAISEADAEAAKPTAERMKPMSEMYQGGSGDLESAINELARVVARFTRCKTRTYVHYDSEHGVWMHKVYGYEGDVRYFTFLYTTLRLHFIGALRPKVDRALSLEDNCYILHNAGYGWQEIAKMYGWTEKYGVWFSPEGIRWEKETRLAVRPYRSAYFRACKARGEEPIKNISPEYFRQDAATGYQQRIRDRLREVEEGRRLTAGTALALRIEDVEQFMREENAERYTRCPACQKLSLYAWQCDVCGNTEGMAPPPENAQPCPRCAKNPSGTCREHPGYSGRWRTRKFSEAGYQAGIRQADSADLGNHVSSAAPKQVR
jgi:rubrerythrin